MRKILLSILFLVPNLSYAAPSNTLSITPTATDGTTITASDENSRNNAISTAYNAHTHTDISQVANTLNVGDAATGNKTITANNADTNKPFIRFNDTDNNWVFSMEGTISSISLTGASIIFEGATDDAFETTLTVTDPTADRTITFPNATGTVAFNGIKMDSFTRDLSAANGNQSITGIGFTPRAFIAFCNVPSTSNTSLGFTDGTTDGSVINKHSEAATQWGSGGNIVGMTTGISTENNATFSSFDSDGITITWTKVGSPSGTVTCRYLAIQ